MAGLQFRHLKKRRKLTAVNIATAYGFKQPVGIRLMKMFSQLRQIEHFNPSRWLSLSRIALPVAIFWACCWFLNQLLTLPIAADVFK